MKKFINKSETEIKETLYYYNQGINIGKEEMLLKILNNLNNMNYKIEEISKITNLSINKIKEYLY